MAVQFANCLSQIMSAVELKLTDMRGDLVPKTFRQCHSTFRFLRQILESEYPELVKSL